MAVKQNFSKWMLRHLRRMVASIAFFPAVLVLVFLLLSYLMIHIDYSGLGKEIKAQARWLKLKDASTARTIISVIAGGILSLTVFSFTMVMVVLNQAASQMSNRVLDRLIGNRYQQAILGFYIGTIVYSLFLLSAIRDVDTGIYVPSLSTYLLIVFAVIDIFFFIYFLHFITQSVKYAVIIRRIQKQTFQSLKASCRLSEEPQTVPAFGGLPLPSPASGIFEGGNYEALVQIAKEENIVLTFLYPQGTYVLCDAPIATISLINQQSIAPFENRLQAHLDINDEQSVSANYYYGFRQLTEVALRALSPGINDPDTAVESLRALADLLCYRLAHFPNPIVKDDDGTVRLLTRELTVEELLEISFLPIWDYGKSDRFIQAEMQHLLNQLKSVQQHPALNKLLQKVMQQRVED